MQYETIILELMSRIKVLEDDVKELKLAQHGFHGDDDAADERDRQVSNGTTYNKLTDEMIDLCYKFGKKVVAGENIQELADDIADATGMNRNSAVINLYVVQCMLEGNVYKRAISAKATKRYYNLIFNEYGSAGLKKAIHATRLHIVYRRECGHTVDSIEEICNDYEGRL